MCHIKIKFDATFKHVEKHIVFENIGLTSYKRCRKVNIDKENK